MAGIYPSSGMNQVDAIRDQGINQGIGNSDLVSQDVQRSDIESNRDLRQALATSQATLANEQEQRLAEARASMAKNQYTLQSQMLTRGASSRSGGGQGGASGVVMFAPNFASGNGSPTGTRGFSLTVPTASGGTENKLFNDIEGLQDYVKNTPGLQGINLVMPGAPIGITDDEQKALEGLNVRTTTGAEAAQLSGIHPRNLIEPGAVNRNINQHFDNETEKQLNSIQSGGKINWGSLPSYAQAQLVDGGFQQVNRLAGSMRNPSSVQDFNSLNETEQVIHAIAGETNLSRKAAMTKYAIENGIISPQRRGY